MLQFRFPVLKALTAAGYPSTRLRAERLLSQDTMNKIRHNDPHINLMAIDTLCRLLRCQPGELIEYIPD